ncbi:MAG: hypothetical protein L6Q76_38815 [Polyangiaceae bacterium]|nr:hypothetical protein [Polyangiaceae bacterium]
MMVDSSPSVRAGEWDDNANYREFQRWLATESRLSFRPVDTSSRQFVVVRDSDGKAVPRCPVTVSDGRRSVTPKMQRPPRPSPSPKATA